MKKRINIREMKKIVCEEKINPTENATRRSKTVKIWAVKVTPEEDQKKTDMLGSRETKN